MNILLDKVTNNNTINKVFVAICTNSLVFFFEKNKKRKLYKSLEIIK